MNKKIQEPYHFSFKEVKTSEQPLVMDWIHKPHINEWLHGDGLNNTIEDLDDFVKGKYAWATHWLALDDDTPFAYLITSGIEPSDMHPKGAVTLDLFIGNLDYLGKGLAVQMIQEFILSQFSDASEIIIDPEQSNVRAVHVYEKAGFQIFDEFIALWHPVPHYKMRLYVENLRKEDD